MSMDACSLFHPCSHNSASLPSQKYGSNKNQYLSKKVLLSNVETYSSRDVECRSTCILHGSLYCMEQDLNDSTEIFCKHQSKFQINIPKKWVVINNQFFLSMKIQDIPDNLQVVWSNSIEWYSFGSILKKKFQKCSNFLQI